MATTIKKNQTAGVGKYSYKYTDLAQIHEYLESMNARYIQKISRIENDDYIMTKRCFDNKWEEEWLQGCKVVDATLIGVKNPAQEQGSALTYARRYSLLMAFGLATEDDDAQSLSKEVEVTEEYARNYVFEFGKHKGRKLIDLVESDDSYIDWLLKNESTSPDILKSIEILTGRKPNPVDLDLTMQFQRALVDSGQDLDKLLDHYEVSKLEEMSNEQKVEAIGIMKKKIEMQEIEDTSKRLDMGVS